MIQILIFNFYWENNTHNKMRSHFALSEKYRNSCVGLGQSFIILVEETLLSSLIDTWQEAMVGAGGWGNVTAYYV